MARGDGVRAPEPGNSPDPRSRAGRQRRNGLRLCPLLGDTEQPAIDGLGGTWHALAPFARSRRWDRSPLPENQPTGPGRERRPGDGHYVVRRPAGRDALDRRWCPAPFVPATLILQSDNSGITELDDRDRISRDPPFPA